MWTCKKRRHIASHIWTSTVMIQMRPINIYAQLSVLLLFDFSLTKLFVCLKDYSRLLQMSTKSFSDKCLQAVFWSLQGYRIRDVTYVSDCFSYGSEVRLSFWIPYYSHLNLSHMSSGLYVDFCLSSVLFVCTTPPPHAPWHKNDI